MTAIAVYREKVTGYFLWRQETSVTVKIALSILFACFTGFMAQVRIPLPWTPVPITGQTFAVLASGFVIGRWGAASQVIYIGAGLLGIPWFSGYNGGIEVMMGPTVGYLLGFVAAAFMVGYLFDNYKRFRSLKYALALVVFANFIIIHGSGLFYLYFWFPASMTVSIPADTFLMMHFIPFVPGGIIKVIIVSQMVLLLYPRENQTDGKKN